jgi:hypothetical protein
MGRIDGVNVRARAHWERRASTRADEPEGALQAVACVRRTRTRSSPLEVRRTTARLVSTGVVRGGRGHTGGDEACMHTGACWKPRPKPGRCLACWTGERAGALTARSPKSGEGRGGGWPALFHRGTSSEVVCPPRRARVGVDVWRQRRAGAHDDPNAPLVGSEQRGGCARPRAVADVDQGRCPAVRTHGATTTPR